MLQFLDSIFNNTVTVENDSAEFEGCTFAVQGASKTDSTTPGLKLVGEAPAVVKNCKFENKGYMAISLQSGAGVSIENCVFDCSNVKNPIEGTVPVNAPAVGDVDVKNCVFDGVCGNNYINFYRMKDGAIVNIENVLVPAASRESEIIRLSNTDNVKATFNIKNVSYTFAEGEVSDYTSFIMCQDYTAKEGKPQDFSKYTVNIDGLVCDGVEVADQKPVDGALFFVYQDKVGIIAGNDPIINM